MNHTTAGPSLIFFVSKLILKFAVFVFLLFETFTSVKFSPLSREYAIAAIPFPSEITPLSETVPDTIVPIPMFVTSVTGFSRSNTHEVFTEFPLRPLISTPYTSIV